MEKNFSLYPSSCASSFNIPTMDLVRVGVGVLYLLGTRVWKVVTQVWSGPDRRPSVYVIVGCADF